MAVGSKDLSIDKLAELSNEELAEKLSESKKELFNIRFQEVTGQANAGRRRTIKRDIARIYTVLRERELGIRPATEGESMDKTVVVEVEDRVKHALYGKVMRRSSKIKAHDEQNSCGVGDLVLLAETRPLSATKRWRVVEILEKAK